MTEITINKLRHKKNLLESDFLKLYKELLSLKPLLDKADIRKLLIWAILFFNQKDDGVKRLGYRIVLRYSNYFKDYIPLYDFSINAGFIPVSKFIENKKYGREVQGDGFLNLYLSSFKEMFKANGKYLSIGQMELLEFSKSDAKDTLIVAPTSYGKSELMLGKVGQNKGKKICIVVPSKALLAQTKRRLLESEEFASNSIRVITHPEMYRKEDETFIAVFTQERVQWVIEKYPDFSVDILMIDEAHTILDSDSRSALLIQILLILRKRNKNTELKFYTPFLSKVESIQSNYSDYVVNFKRVDEFIKIEKYYFYDALGNKELLMYDQFLNEYFPISQSKNSEIDFLLEKSAEKNIVYLNKPRDVEDVAEKLSDRLGAVGQALDKEHVEAYKAISDFLHPEYKLLKCLKNGVIYHHGKIPEVIRLYIELIYSKNANVRFIATTSTLLEGVNIPAEKMFLLNVKKGRSQLTRSAFKNLVGRVCRFSEVFSEKDGSLRMLEPEIYIIKGNYMSANFAYESFFSTRVKWKDVQTETDEIGNPLLKNELQSDEDIENLKSAIEYIENVEPGTLNAENTGGIRYVESRIAQLCFKNNIHEFDIHLNEPTLVNNLSRIPSKYKINDLNVLLEVISFVFIHEIQHYHNDEFVRLANKAAQNFYALVLSWRMRGASFNEMIRSVLAHWTEKKEQALTREDNLVYVGHSWGEEKRNIDEFIENYIDIRKKSHGQLVNLAIVRIKEEMDFVEHNLLRYIEILNELELVDQAFYEQIKYGSSDPYVICLLKNGFSVELTKILIDKKYKEYINFDLLKDRVEISRSAYSALDNDGVNKVLLFELSFHLVK